MKQTYEFIYQVTGDHATEEEAKDSFLEEAARCPDLLEHMARCELVTPEDDDETVSLTVRQLMVELTVISMLSDNDDIGDALVVFDLPGRELDSGVNASYAVESVEEEHGFVCLGTSV